MLPLKDSNPTSRTAWVTLALIAANVAIFLLWEPTFGHSAEQQQVFYYCHAEVGYEVTHHTSLASGGPGAAAAIQAGLSVDSRTARGLQRFLGRRCPGKSWWQSVIVAMFLHGGWIHIAGNMLFLWIFGNNVEDRIGPAWYLLFYLIGGVAASALQVVLDPSSVVPSLGASGAIAAVLGAYLVLFPRARVTTLVIFFFITVIELPAVVVLGGWFLLQLFSGVGGLGTQVNAGVAYWAHVGGFVAGVVIAYLFFPKRRRPAPWSPGAGPFGSG